jgi:hypothetical protein
VSAAAATHQTVETQASRSATHSENSIRAEDSNWTWRHVEDDIKLEVAIRGRVEFADDYSDVTTISDGGSIRVTDEKGGVTRKFEARATAVGVQRSYWVNGAARQIDQEARAWLAKVLDDTVRQGGYDARPRVQRILKQGGPNAVLKEISRLKGDYVKRIYFDELFNNGKLDDETVRLALHQAATEIHSDYEKAQLLVKMSEDYLANDGQRAIYLEGVNTIHSDYEKGRALGALLKKGNLGRENMLFALRAVKNISSDYERAQLLIKIANAFALDESAREAYLEAVATLRSDYEKGRVFSAFLKKGQGDTKNLLFVLKSAPGISSDYERAQLLIKVASAGAGDESVRSALVDAARTIHSEYERGRVLSAVFK